jgi:hypothetical protein
VESQQRRAPAGWWTSAPPLPAAMRAAPPKLRAPRERKAERARCAGRGARMRPRQGPRCVCRAQQGAPLLRGSSERGRLDARAAPDLEACAYGVSCVCLEHGHVSKAHVLQRLLVRRAPGAQLDKHAVPALAAPRGRAARCDTDHARTRGRRASERVKAGLAPGAEVAGAAAAGAPAAVLAAPSAAAVAAAAAAVAAPAHARGASGAAKQARAARPPEQRPAPVDMGVRLQSDRFERFR